VVITKDPLTTYLPIQRKPESGPVENAPVVTQYEMHGVEELGLLKMDFLGLRNLDVITDTVALVAPLATSDVRHRQRPARRPGDLRAARPRRHDRRVPARVAADAGADAVAGAHQFEDVAALVALYRPGPMSVNMHYDYADRKNGRKPVDYFHPDAEEVLATRTA
jgi:DNA polymerase-3 subunit alpha